MEQQKIDRLREEMLKLQNEYHKEFVKDILGVHQCDADIGNEKLSGYQKIETQVANELRKMRRKFDLSSTIAKKSKEISDLYMKRYLHNEVSLSTENTFRNSNEEGFLPCSTTSIANKSMRQAMKLEPDTNQNTAVVFLDIDFTELAINCNQRSLNLVGLTKLGAFGTNFHNDGWKTAGLTFKRAIIPKWISTLVTNRSEAGNDCNRKGSIIRSRDLSHLFRWAEIKDEKMKLKSNENDWDFIANYQKNLDEEKAVTDFASYLELVAEKLRCNKIIIATFHSSFVQVGTIETILPLQVILSKLTQYRKKETFDKYVVGYTDLLSSTARKNFNKNFKDKNNRNNYYFNLQKPFAKAVIDKLEHVMGFTWPDNEKCGSQALGGLMTLLSYFDSEKCSVEEVILISSDDFQDVKLNMNYCSNANSLLTNQASSLPVYLKKGSFPEIRFTKSIIMNTSHCLDGNNYTIEFDTMIPRNRSKISRSDIRTKISNRGDSKNRYINSQKVRLNKQNSLSRKRLRSSNKENVDTRISTCTVDRSLAKKGKLRGAHKIKETKKQLPSQKFNLYQHVSMEAISDVRKRPKIEQHSPAPKASFNFENLCKHSSDVKLEQVYDSTEDCGEQVEVSLTSAEPSSLQNSIIEVPVPPKRIPSLIDLTTTDRSSDNTMLQ